MKYQTNSSFRLDKSLKRLLCLMNDRTQRLEFKKLFIEAQLGEIAAKKKQFKGEKETDE